MSTAVLELAVVPRFHRWLRAVREWNIGSGASLATPSVFSNNTRAGSVLAMVLTISATTGIPAILPTRSVLDERPVAEARAFLAVLGGLGPQHQVREVDIPRVRRHVRTLGHVAHVAQVTVVDDLPVDLLVDAVQLQGGRLVDGIKQGGEGVAQAEAAAAAVADVENPLQLLVERGLVVEFGVTPIERMARGGFEAPFASAF